MSLADRLQASAPGSCNRQDQTVREVFYAAGTDDGHYRVGDSWADGRLPDAARITSYVVRGRFSAGRTSFYRAVDDAWQEAQGASTVSESTRLGIRLAATHAVRISADVARAMYELAGASAIYEESPLQRRFRDAHTAIAHFQVNARSFELPGRLLLGLPSVTTQL